MGALGHAVSVLPQVAGATCGYPSDDRFTVKRNTNCAIREIRLIGVRKFFKIKSDESLAIVALAVFVGGT